MLALTWYTYTDAKRTEYFDSVRALVKRLMFLKLKGHVAYVEVL